jgi:hypothetical protein
MGGINARYGEKNAFNLNCCEALGLLPAFIILRRSYIAKLTVCQVVENSPKAVVVE